MTTETNNEIRRADHAKRVKTVLSRNTVLDLREMIDISDAEIRYAEAEFDLRIVSKGEKNFIKWFVVESGANRYEIRRFKNFCFCACKDFFFTQKTCKHIVETMPARCVCCRKIGVDRGGECETCEQDNAIYLKESSTRKPELVGGIRIA